ncbi:MAG: YdeI/OmpD-associated family protein [Patescibacteria group bacterium]|nr:YdeI/OmpD-associated family protein [Patescibacteria group bacterium]
MVKITIASGTVHKVPADLKEALTSSHNIHSAWNSLTPLARNEWICWVISVKKQETRKKHIERIREDLAKGKRRPCYWQGCPHR